MAGERRFRTELAPPPSLIVPMRPRSISSPLENPRWISEVKLNGFRAITHILRGRAPVIRTSTGRDISVAFPELKPGLEALGQRHSLVLDGEIVFGNGKTGEEMRVAVARAQGTRFTAPTNARQFPCQYVVFDLLHFDREDYMEKPLVERKAKLARTIIAAYSKEKIVVLPHAKPGTNLAKSAEAFGYEGVVYKNPQSLYYPGENTYDWLKFKFKR